MGLYQEPWVLSSLISPQHPTGREVSTTEDDTGAFNALGLEVTQPQAGLTQYLTVREAGMWSLALCPGGTGNEF